MNGRGNLHVSSQAIFVGIGMKVFKGIQIENERRSPILVTLDTKLLTILSIKHYRNKVNKFSQVT